MPFATASHCRPALATHYQGDIISLAPGGHVMLPTYIHTYLVPSDCLQFYACITAAAEGFVILFALLATKVAGKTNKKGSRKRESHFVNTLSLSCCCWQLLCLKVHSFDSSAFAFELQACCLAKTQRNQITSRGPWVVCAISRIRSRLKPWGCSFNWIQAGIESFCSSAAVVVVCLRAQV